MVVRLWGGVGLVVRLFKSVGASQIMVSWFIVIVASSHRLIVASSHRLIATVSSSHRHRRIVSPSHRLIVMVLSPASHGLIIMVSVSSSSSWSHRRRDGLIVMGAWSHCHRHRLIVIVSSSHRHCHFLIGIVSWSHRHGLASAVSGTGPRRRSPSYNKDERKRCTALMTSLLNLECRTILNLECHDDNTSTRNANAWAAMPGLR